MPIRKKIDLFFVPARVPVQATIMNLTPRRIRTRMGEAWWISSEIDPRIAAREIDRDWDWTTLRIERNGKLLGSRKLAIVTGDGSVQGAAMHSTEPVESVLESGRQALFVELLFTAPRNRAWIRLDRAEQYRGVGLELLIATVEESVRAGCDGRLMLESSPGFVDWYAKRGLLKTSQQPILHEDVIYTPMELTPDAVARLLAGS